MSIRAYKINNVNVEPSFNLWTDKDLLAFFEASPGDYEDQTKSTGGIISIRVSLLQRALNNPALWVEDDYRIAQIQDDIEGKDSDEWIEYDCL